MRRRASGAPQALKRKLCHRMLCKISGGQSLSSCFSLHPSKPLFLPCPHTKLRPRTGSSPSHFILSLQPALDFLPPISDPPPSPPPLHRLLAVAPGIHHQRARRAGPRVAQQQAGVAAAARQLLPTELPARVRGDPGVERGVALLAAEAPVGGGDGRGGVALPACAGKVQRRASWLD